jgi:hypothetical protein
MNKLIIKDAQNIAEKRGGICLSENYINSRAKLLWECAKGHRWMARMENIKYQSQWCPYCAGVNKRTISDMQALAKKHGGKCLSTDYFNARTKLKWECSQGHQWSAKPNYIQQGNWCPYCANNVPLTIERMRQLAQERGGRCLSRVYLGIQKKLLWQCANGHKWKAKPNSIQQGGWCAICSSGLGERICREFFERIFRKPFPKSRPPWLKNIRKNQMELDGYCKSLKIAFEHQGGQHYSEKSLYINNSKDLKIRKADDKLKRKLCHENGVVLIAIPEIPRFLPIEEIKYYLSTEFLKNGIMLPKDFDNIKVDLKTAYSSSIATEYMLKIKQIVKNKGGVLLSEKYVNSSTKLRWRCSKGHEWEAVPNSINQGKWCYKCGRENMAQKERLTIDLMIKIAESRGGKCLSDKYKNKSLKLLWECSEGHRWEASPGNVKNRKSWCPICAKNKKRKTLL